MVLISIWGLHLISYMITIELVKVLEMLLELQDLDLPLGLSQDSETGCSKLAIVKFLGVQIFKGNNNILRFQQYTIYQNRA